MSHQNDLEHLIDMVQRGEMTTAQANVEQVRMQRFRLVTNKIPAEIRKQLNEAVKLGTLGRMKKDGLKPEAYFHPSFERLANNARKEHEQNILSVFSIFSSEKME